MKSARKRHLWLAIVFVSGSWAGIVPDRYIVELDDEPVAGRMASHGQHVNQLEAARHRVDVRLQQSQTKAALEQQGAEVLDSLDTVLNALMVRMPASEAAKLARVPGVKSVHPVREFKLLLDRAVVVHKIADAWNVIGLDQAGAGMKIALIDTGIDNTHPGFQDPSLTIPAGFPKVNKDTDKTYTNQKVIVARSYAQFLTAEPDPSARDRQGHGTATAMAAAGVLNSGPLATIRGVAPKAYLGNYKVFGSPGVNDNAPEDAILKAIDDAVADGMDVINLSLGDAVASVLPEDLEAISIQRATNMGAIVVVAAGNSGPDPHTIGSPGGAPAAISVGASLNDRSFNAGVTVGGSRYVAIPGSGPAPAQPVSAPIKDVTTLGDDGLACSPMAAGSLQGSIAFVLRGTCLFSDKIANVAAGGAVGALVYTDETRPDAIVMSVGSATLPAMMVSYGDGISIKQHLAKASRESAATLDFTLQPTAVDPDKLADFSAQGPDVNGSIKPDLVAVGTNVYTATQKFDTKGDVYDPSGYALVDGTSLSSPIVAGAAALLKAARPGLTVAQYRSLLINSASQGFLSPGVPARVQQAGAGSLDMNAVLKATGAVSPTSFSFGIGTGSIQQSQTLTIANVGTAPETFTLFVAERGMPTVPVPAGSRTETLLQTSGQQPHVTISTHSLTVNAGATATVTVSMTAFGLPAGAYEGFVHILGTNSGVDQRVPYWYGVGSTTPARITILSTATTPAPGSLTNDAAFFRITDVSGITVPGMKPHATVVSGGGSVRGIVSDDSFLPGIFSLNVRLGPTAGSNVFRIQVGNLTQDVTVVSK
jgi:minor extracellular serine protease Vpr